MVDRLTAINWTDYATGDKHEASRTLLMREFLRRTALWVNFLGGTERWPFFDVAERIDPSVRADPGLIKRLKDFTEENIPEFIARRMCRAAVHWAELQDCTQARLPDLPDPYEPLVVLYERGGVFFVENGVADFASRRVPLRTWRAHLSRAPIVQVDPLVLDAADREAK